MGVAGGPGGPGGGEREGLQKHEGVGGCLAVRLARKPLSDIPEADCPSGWWAASNQLKARLEPETKLPEQERILQPAALDRKSVV